MKEAFFLTLPSVMLDALRSPILMTATLVCILSTTTIENSVFQALRYVHLKIQVTSYSKLN